MNVKITDTFTKSLERIIRHNTWWYKIYQVLRWDLWLFCKNIWLFRKALWNHRWWDYRFTLEMMETSLTIMEKGMQNGNEVRESLDKKLSKMQRAIEILNHLNKDSYIELAEKQLGYEYQFNRFFIEADEDGMYKMIDDDPDVAERNRAIFKLSDDIKEAEWNELWDIFKGRNKAEILAELKDIQDYNERSERYNKWCDGSDLRGWWD